MRNMHSLFLVRHAHAEWSPDENRPLSSTGMRDAKRVAEILAPYLIAKIVSSPYLRARQTIQRLASLKGLRVEVSHDLRERELGRSSATGFEESVRAAWAHPHLAHAGGESNLEAQRRGVGRIRQLVSSEPHGHMVLSTHGNLLALILQHYDPRIDYEFWMSLSMPDIYRLDLPLEGEPAHERLWSG